MKKLALLLLIIFLAAFSTSVYSYDMQTIANIPIADKISGIGYQASGIVAISSETKTLYVINTSSNAITRKIPLDITPSSVAIDSRNNSAIVSSQDGTLHYIDLQTGNTTRTLSVKRHSAPPIEVEGMLDAESITYIHSITISPETDILYIGTDDRLMLIDLKTESIIKETLLPDAVTDMDIDSSSNSLLITMKGKEGLYVYDGDTFEINTGEIPSGVAVNSSTHIAVLTNNSDNSISIVSLKDKTVLETIPFQDEPSAVAVNQVNNTALISHAGGIAVVKLENPVPVINTIIPSSGRAGDPGLTLSIKGEKFIKDSKAGFDTKELTTRFQNNSSLQADVPSSELQLPKNVDVSVVNPLPGGGRSNTLTFNIYNPIPVLDYISPDTIPLSHPELDSGSKGSIILRVYGKNFMPLSIANLNGNNLKTKFISSILLEAAVNPSDIPSTGKYAIVVITPPPGTFTSNAVYLNVVEDEAAAQMSLQSETEAKILSSAQNNVKGKATLRGRILNTNKEPIEGVTVKIKNISVVTDADGYFRLDNVPAGKRHVMVHGSTAKDANSRYPTIPLTIDIQANTITEMPFQIYLHKQKNRSYKSIDHNRAAKMTGAEAPGITTSGDIIVTDPEVPGFEMRIPKDVKITGWDGKPNKKVSVRTVPIDRLPVKPLPPNADVRTVYMFHFDKVGGGIPDAPIPIKARNDLGLLPGEKAVLWYYDESPNEGEAPNDWAIAGTGTVTPDGKYIVSDPGVGIPKFCCGATAWGGTGSGNDPSGPEDPDCSGPSTMAGDPVDVATGYFLHKKTDLQIPGIIPVNITRYYRSRESGSAVTGSVGLGMFGKGTYFEYDWWLGAYKADGTIDTTGANTTMYLLIKPGNYQYRFDVRQADGTFINDSNPSMRGAVITKNTDNTKTLRMRNGWAYKFDQSGDMIEMADRNGNKLAFERRSDFEGGALKKITTPEGRTITFNQTYTTGPVFRTDSIVDDTTGRTIIYTYDDDPFSSYPRLKKITYYPDGSSIEYKYDSSGRMSEIINERGIREVLNEYDANNRIFRQTHPDGGIYTFSYDIAGSSIVETTMTAPNGSQTTWGFYDYATGSNYYDRYITYMITPDGTTVYDRALADNQTTGEIRNAIKSITDPLSRKTEYTYYSNGQKKTVKDNLNNVTSYEYEPVYGLPTKITNALLKDTTFTYTYGAGNNITKVEIGDPLLKLTTVNLNTYGMPTDITDPNQNTTWFLYENTGKPSELTKVKDMLNNTYLLGYDALGRLWTVTDAKGKTTEYSYDKHDRITEVKDPMNGLTRYAYGATGNLLTVTDAKNQTIRYEYDERDRLKKIIDQLGREEIYTYYTGAEITSTTGDNLKSITDRKGQITIFNEYDSAGMVKKITYHDGSYVEYTYDLAGRVDYINDSVSGFIDYTYNDFGCTSCSGRGMDRIAQEVTPLGTIDYTYNAVGRRKTMQVLGQPVANYDYYDNGWLENIRQVMNGIEQKFNFVYDDGGRRERLKYFKGGASTPATETVYQFNTANMLENIQHLQGANILENLVYGYDANGNRTSMNRPSVNLPTPNPVSNTSYNEANQMLTFNDKNITYDNNDNMTSVTNTCGTTNYTWDVRNRLVGINGFNTDCSSLSASFKYDALGRRFEKTINGITTQYLYDGVDIIQEKQSGVVTANYIRGLNIDEPLLRSTQNAVRLYLTDALGSVIVLADDIGVVRTTFTYDPFGNVTVSGEASDNPFQYTGRENDGTGLYYYRTRYYSPELQRFISPDPLNLKTVILLKQSSSKRVRDLVNLVYEFFLIYPQALNEYLYVINNPTYWIDPYGLKSSNYIWPYSWKGWTGVTLGGIGAVVFFIPGGQVIGGGLMIAGGAFTLWDVYEGPREAWEDAEKALQPSKDAVNDLKKQLEEYEECDKNKRRE